MAGSDRQTVQPLPELLNVVQVAEYLGLHRATVVAFARRGKLPAFKVGREWRFRADEIKAWLDLQRRGRDPFVERFDRLWDRIRSGAEQSGYRAEDIPGLVEEVRRQRAARGASGA